MTQVLVVGGGFAGIACAAALRREAKQCRVTVLDQRPSQDFLPLLPDMVGRGMTSGAVSADISGLCRRCGAAFLRRRVTSIDTAARRVFAGAEAFSYDYLVVATGTETNFYGNDAVAKRAFRVDCAADAAALSEAVSSGRHEHYLVVGGGYTGIEIATNIRRALIRSRRNMPVTVVERQPSILGPLPEWMKEYVAGRLRRWRISVEANASLEKLEEDTAFLSSGKMFPRALVVWAAGVRTGECVQSLPFGKNPQGRVKVDGTLRVDERCFVVGDAGVSMWKGEPLRMAVQFAVSQGESAGRSSARLQQGLGLTPYVPFDAGYIVPLADNTACGIVLGVSLRGWLPLGLHYAVSIFRSAGLKHRWRVIRDLCTGGGR